MGIQSVCWPQGLSVTESMLLASWHLSACLTPPPTLNLPSPGTSLPFLQFLIPTEPSHVGHRLCWFFSLGSLVLSLSSTTHPPTSFYGLVQSGCFQVHLAVVSCVSTMKLFSTTPWRLQVLIFIQGEMTYIFQLGISTQRVKAVCSQS